jgi:stage V sporulation protein B
MNMKPTAISQVLEQVVKLGFGLILVIILMPKVEYAVAGATFAITLSEIVALAFLYLSFRKFKRKNNLRYNFDKRKLKALNKSIIKLTIPITIVGIFLPLSQVIDSFLVLNILGKYLENATSLYGLLSGVVATVIGLPVAICYGVATVAIPAVSRSKAKEEQKKSALKTLLLTLAVALPATLACYLFAPTIIMLLFRGLSVQERSVAISLLKLSSPCILLLSILQTANGILIGKGKPYLPVLSLGLGVTVKEILNIILLKVPKLNIYGSAIAIIACYFTVCLVNLIMIFAVKESRLKNESKRTLRRQYAG